jgi:hypothetical protein
VKRSRATNDVDRNEHIKVQLEVLLAEYTALKTEIVSNLNAGRQVVGLTLTAVAALIGVGPAIVASGGSIVFLIAPLFFYALAWTQLRYVSLVLAMGKYLRCHVAPSIRCLLSDLAGNAAAPEQLTERFRYVMKWEEAGRSLTRAYAGIERILFVPIAGANFGIPLLAAVASVTTYFLTPGGSPRATEVSLVVVDGIGLVYSAYWGWRAERER